MGNSVLTPKATGAPCTSLVVVSKLDGLPDKLQAQLANSPKLIGTHDGTFHCDEALACAMVKMLPEFENAVVVRTREQELLDKCDIVVDVGAVYDHEKLRYDHHQPEFTDVMGEFGHKTKLSSAGLIYRHYGKQVIDRIARSKGASSLDVDEVHRKLYKTFIEHIDGIDNGIEAFNGARNYQVPTTLPSRVGALNPRWNQEKGDEVRNASFATAVQMCGQEFKDHLEELACSWWPARAFVKEALEGAAALDPSRRIISLSHGDGLPWKEHLFEMEAKMKLAGDTAAEGAAWYLIYEDAKGQYRVSAVPVEENSYTSRRKLPEAWLGKRGEELDKVTGVEGGTFVHTGGFIGGHKTFQGALALAKKAIAEN